MTSVESKGAATRPYVFNFIAAKVWLVSTAQETKRSE